MKLFQINETLHEFESMPQFAVYGLFSLGTHTFLPVCG